MYPKYYKDSDEAKQVFALINDEVKARRRVWLTRGDPRSRDRAVDQQHPRSCTGARPRHALRHDRITAPWFIEQPINGETFQLYVEKVLVSTLKPGDIVIMDNLGSHKGKAVRRAIRAAGARLFYSCRI